MHVSKQNPLFFVLPSSAEGDRRSAVEVARSTIRQNRETLSSLKREQKEVKAELKSRNDSCKAVGGRSNIEKEILALEKKADGLRRSHDQLFQRRLKSAAKLAQAEDGLRDIERSSSMGVNAPLQKTLRSVENRLEKVRDMILWRR